MNTKENIYQALLSLGKGSALDLAKSAGISRQATLKHLNSLIEEKRIERRGGEKKGAYYVPAGQVPSQHKEASLPENEWNLDLPFSLNGLREDDVYRDIQNRLPALSSLKKNVEVILHNAFTEMLNNAIDHSESNECRVCMKIDEARSTFLIEDQGVGVFEKIRRTFELDDEYDAVGELLKGKRTTAREAHSGEGIFFTSKMADRFELSSHEIRLIVTPEDVFLEKSLLLRGTRVLFEISSNSSRSAEGVYRNYTNEETGFDKTVIVVYLFKKGENFISRSEAKRLLSGLENFSRIVLDYKGVAAVGQAFADEVYRVFQNRHPEISIESINCVEPVAFMINRAKRTV